MADPEGSDSSKEWMELYNSGGVPFYFSGCIVRGRSGSFVIEGSLAVEAGGYVVIGRGATATGNFVVPVDYRHDAFLLGNSGGKIEVF